MPLEASGVSPPDEACGLRPGPGERLLGEPSLIGLMAWSDSRLAWELIPDFATASAESALPEMGLTCESLLRASLRKFL